VLPRETGADRRRKADRNGREVANSPDGGGSVIDPAALWDARKVMQRPKAERRLGSAT